MRKVILSHNHFSKEHIEFKGLEATVGIPSNLGKFAESDAGLVSVLYHLGAVPFCRTNLPQTNISYDCSNPIFGATLNPRDLTRSPGGSSGGEAALIAGGGSIMGFGK
jgi:fatty acid amide hydrolase